MGTTLMWSSCCLSQHFYKLILGYPHKITLDGANHIIFVETRRKRLIPFWISFIPTSISLLFSVMAISEFVNDNPFVSLPDVVLQICFASFILMSHGLNYVIIRNAKDLCSLYFNTLVEFEARLRIHKAIQIPFTFIGTLRLAYHGK